MQRYQSIYRGIVVGVDDPQKRNRYQVHVSGIHRFFSDVPVTDATQERKAAPLGYALTELHKLREGGNTADSAIAADVRFTAYPWAETLWHGGAGQGSPPVYHIGDPVFVMFEAGDPNYPFILAGWHGARWGADGLAPEVTGEYEINRHQQRWDDLAGNSIVLYDLADAAELVIKSGAAQLTLGQHDDSISATASTIRAVSNLFTVASDETVALGKYLLFQAVGEVIGEESDEYPRISFYSQWDVEIWAKDEINIGQYLSQAPDGDDERTLYYASRLAAIWPKHLILGTVGTATREAYSSLPNLVDAEDTITVDVEGREYVILRSPGDTVDEGFIGGYANWRMEWYAVDRIWIGQYMDHQIANTPHQSEETIIQAAKISIGMCTDGSLYVPNSLLTQTVEVLATDLITVATCGASVDLSGYCANGATVGLGDVIVWANHNLILGANDSVIMPGGVLAVENNGAAEGRVNTLNIGPWLVGEAGNRGAEITNCKLYLEHPNPRAESTQLSWLDIDNYLSYDGTVTLTPYKASLDAKGHVRSRVAEAAVTLDFADISPPPGTDSERRIDKHYTTTLAIGGNTVVNLEADAHDWRQYNCTAWLRLSFSGPTDVRNTAGGPTAYQPSRADGFTFCASNVQEHSLGGGVYYYVARSQPEPVEIEGTFDVDGIGNAESVVARIIIDQTTGRPSLWLSASALNTTSAEIWVSVNMIAWATVSGTGADYESI